MGKRSRRKGGHPARDPRAHPPEDFDWLQRAKGNGLDGDELDQRREQNERLMRATGQLVEILEDTAVEQSLMLAGESPEEALARTGGEGANESA